MVTLLKINSQKMSRLFNIIKTIFIIASTTYFLLCGIGIEKFNDNHPYLQVREDINNKFTQ